MEPVERATKLETVFQPYGNFSPGHMLCIWADRSYMWENDTVVISVTIKLMKRVVWQLMSTQYMYDLGIAVTSNQDCLTTHKRSKQEGVRYTCNKCEYTTYQKKNLTNHNHSKHDKVWYHCDECKYKATCMVIWTLTNSSPVLESLWTVIPVINVNKNAFLLCGLPNIWNVHGNMYVIIRTLSRHSTMWHVS